MSANVGFSKQLLALSTECIARPKNKVVVNKFRQRHSRPLGPKWGLSSWLLRLWDLKEVYAAITTTATRTTKAAKVLITETPILKEHYIFFWYISLPSLHDYDVKSPFSFFFLLKLNEVSINSTPGNFANKWQVKWFGIIAIKVKGPNTFYWCRFQCRRRCCELRNQRRLN